MKTAALTEMRAMKRTIAEDGPSEVIEEFPNLESGSEETWWKRFSMRR
jgi:hypothetical protein